MEMGYGLQQEQTQKLVMTPELRQAITVLQLSAVDLMEFIREQMHENPLLVMNDPDPFESDSPAETKERTGTDIDWEDYVRRQSTGEWSPPDGQASYHAVDHLSSDAVALSDVLLEQLRFATDVDREMRACIEYLIGNLDEDGYLRVPLQELASETRWNAEMVEAALRRLQTFDPMGVAARSLQECLQIQMKRLNVKDPLVDQIIRRHLSELAEGRLQSIAQNLNVKKEEVQSAADFIRTLSPRPGSEYQVSAPRYIVPDVTVEKVEGEYVVLMNDRVAPRLKIHAYYRRLLQENQAQKEAEREYIQKKLNAAMWLIKNIEQRRMTLYKVTEAIVDRQKAFFDKGPDYLVPMTLKDIANQIDMHESTVSRATNHKYAQTPRGLFELKEFFVKGLTTTDGRSMSVERVKNELQKLVDAEDKKKPLSDQKITQQLKQKGIAISRRTVAKYREEMGIASSAKRKRY